MINAVATVLGCLALVVMIATVVRVVMIKLWESARVNPEYVQSVYEKDMERRWSGKSREQPALLGSETLAPPMASSQKNDNSTAASDSSIADIENKRLKIEQTIRGFFGASTAEQQLAYCRDPQRVRPLMLDYYRSHPHTPLEWKALGWLLPVEEPGYRLGYAQAIFTNAEPVSLIIEEQSDNSFRVDWESSVRYSELDWEEFIKTQPTSPKLFRVIASKPQTSPPEALPTGSELLEIKHPDDNNVIYAYFDRKDPKFQPLIQQLQSGNWKDVPLTLRLCYPGPVGSGKNARIADVEGKGWLILHGTRS
ncbi:hypothetical protein [Prosthecobacter vanneervenii]|uniref:Uncharacterized protein n=1 Tax=Prosthecobacter vanneervenii TaxID=48466 RepID=A0A7W7YCC0_9BACT|nr:hypothetical protein [Prosthecobacter vanneervenii]MBB5033551.1 hypothetical protein [Prosthecobacter vanneervenii]